MNEAQAFDKVINCLTDFNLRQPKDYIIKYYKNGCFVIRLCPHRYSVIDVQYFYDNVPDIKIFRFKQKRDIVELNIKVKIRDGKYD